jgi:hypothetical protein
VVARAIPGKAIPARVIRARADENLARASSLSSEARRTRALTTKPSQPKYDFTLAGTVSFGGLLSQRGKRRVSYQHR